jgi:hypothetical protein
MGLISDYFSAQSVAESSPADALAWLNLLCVYVGYGTLLMFGYIREYYNRLVGNTPFKTRPVRIDWFDLLIWVFLLCVSFFE